MKYQLVIVAAPSYTLRLMGIPLRVIGAGLVIANVRAFLPLEYYRLGAPQYGHVSAVVGMRVPQYLQFTFATSLITT